MSKSYNHINGQQRSKVSSNPATSNSLGHHRNNNQFDNDFMHHREMSSTNHTDMSSSSAQLTSKTALLVRQRRALLEQLSCSLCQGYLIDATTIDDCMDSFCKSCIIIYFRTHNDCPKCGAIIQKPVEAAIKPDKILQDIVYKLIPGLYDNEMKRRRNFYRGHLNGYVSSDDEEDVISSNGNGSVTNEKYGIVKRPKPFYKPTDNIDLSIEPQTRGEDAKIYYDNKRQSIVTCFTGRLQQRDLNIGPIFTSVDSQLFKTYLRCPGRFTVAQLKKFIAAKFNVSRDDTIQLFYLNESLKDDYSLIDLAYIYDWRGTEHMQLFYIIERDLSKAVVFDVRADVGDHDRAISRQTSSVGIQASKRVCIDPEPRYCEDKSNSKEVATKNGRSMRSRDIPFGIDNASRVVVRRVASPIIKTSTNLNQEKRMPTVYSNGLQTRGVQAYKTNSNTATQVEHSRSLRSQQPSQKGTLTTPPKSNTTLNNNNCSGSGNRFSDSNNNGQRSALIVTKLQQGTQSSSDASKSVANDSGTTGAPISSVTLANFTEARANHVLATVTATTSSIATATSASTMSLSGKDSGDNRTSYVQKMTPVATTITKSFVAATNSTSESRNVPPTPRMAFSFVTERGITIVQRLNNSSNQQSINTNTITSQNQTLPVASQSQQQQAGNQSQPIPHNQRSSISPNVNQNRTTVGSIQSFSPSSSPANQQIRGSNQRNLDGVDDLMSMVTPRHQIKVKPVYKTFVDPTKLKSPNLKKLGSTARH